MYANPRLFLLYGDIGNNLFNSIRDDFPDRVENAGIAEASMVGIAAGLSQAGYIPVCYTINSFLYLKAVEQIKLDLAYPARKALLVGTGGGLAYASLGTSHHSLEDYAVLGSIPNLRLYSPADNNELDCSLTDALTGDGPSYIRIGKKGEIDLLESQGQLEPLLRPFRVVSKNSRSKLAVVTVGTIGGDFLTGIKDRAESVEFDHYSLFRIRPWSSVQILEDFQSYERILIIEDHYTLSGVASLFLAAFSESRTKIYSAALPIEFFTGKGDKTAIREVGGLGISTLLARARALS